MSEKLIQFVKSVFDYAELTKGGVLSKIDDEKTILKLMSVYFSLDDDDMRKLCKAMDKIELENKT